MTGEEDVPPGDAHVDSDLEAFWTDAKIHVNLTELAPYIGEHPLSAVRPPECSFGTTPEQADLLLGLILTGQKTATASALWDYEAAGEQLPRVGQLCIVLDGRGRPRALLRTDSVAVVPFDEVDEGHAVADGGSDGSLARWREVHRGLFSERFSPGRGFAEDMPVVLERFTVLHASRV
ncbi:ASCH domain-containing protein [Austwickia chelonae]|uniref:ASCH domain-containing protein n=1 Tax=Austwickia chelonae TaxID=100225 RepID=UPI000E224ECD|nr:ASCH domain-containing protein [Austwickia chelonae]